MKNTLLFGWCLYGKLGIVDPTQSDQILAVWYFRQIESWYGEHFVQQQVVGGTAGKNLKTVGSCTLQGRPGQTAWKCPQDCGKPRDIGR